MKFALQQNVNLTLSPKIIKDHQFEQTLCNDTLVVVYRCKRCKVYCTIYFNRITSKKSWYYSLNGVGQEELTCNEFIIKDIIE